MRKKLTLEKLANKLHQLDPSGKINFDRSENCLYFEPVSGLDSIYTRYIKFELDNSTILASDCKTGYDALKARLNHDVDTTKIEQASNYLAFENHDATIADSQINKIMLAYFNYFRKLDELFTKSL